MRTANPDCYTYTEHGSKNRSGGLSQLRVENKSVPCYAVQENRPRCLVYLLDSYLNKLPQMAFKEDILYCRPKTKAPLDEKSPWYDAIPVGRNKLGSMVKEMCAEAGILVRTNHSLRATGVTTMFQASVPEQMIQKTTGHQSIEGLRTYERVSAEQHQAVSNLMMAGTSSSFQEELAKSTTVTTKQMSRPTASGAVFSSKAVVGGQDGFRNLFGNITNCTIGKLTVNINPAITVQQSVEEEFDELVRDVDFYFLKTC